MLEQVFLDTKVIAILRNIPAHFLQPLLEAMEKGGIRMAEITLNSGDALDSIQKMRHMFDGRIHIGAGTVTDSSLLTKALDAGAEFIVTPNIDPKVIEHCVSRNIFIAPGAFSPTEIFQARSLGSTYVKVFPAASLGSRYIKDVLGPLGTGTKLIAVGGIDSTNASEYIQSGAVGVGVGGSLSDLNRIRENDFDWIESEAKRLIASCTK